jgi:hypothetical protein
MLVAVGCASAGVTSGCDEMRNTRHDNAPMAPATAESGVRSDEGLKSAALAIGGSSSESIVLRLRLIKSKQTRAFRICHVPVQTGSQPSLTTI